MLDRWLDRDDLTDEDLRELTAEEEVMDWMTGSPAAPATPRPGWLPEGRELSDPEPRDHGPPPPASTPPWGLVVSGAFAVAALGVIGVTGVASLAVGFFLL